MSENKFSVSTREANSAKVLDISGYLDAHTAPMMEKAISDSIESGAKNLVVNFAGLDYISSAGLGVFMAFIEDLRSQGGDLKMSDMKDKVFAVFDLLGFPLLFDIVEKEEVAINKFQSTGD